MKTRQSARNVSISFSLTDGQAGHEVRHGVAQVRVVLDGVLLEQGQHRGAVLRRVQHQD